MGGVELNGMQTHGLCIRDTVLYQLSYEPE